MRAQIMIYLIVQPACFIEILLLLYQRLMCPIWAFDIRHPPVWETESPASPPNVPPCFFSPLLPFHLRTPVHKAPWGIIYYIRGIYDPI